MSRKFWGILLKSRELSTYVHSCHKMNSFNSLIWADEPSSQHRSFEGWLGFIYADFLIFSLCRPSLMVSPFFTNSRTVTNMNIELCFAACDQCVFLKMIIQMPPVRIHKKPRPPWTEKMRNRPTKYLPKIQKTWRMRHVASTGTQLPTIDCGCTYCRLTSNTIQL